MLEFFGTISLALLLLWGYIVVASLHKRLAVKLTVCISDQFTEVFDNYSTSLVRIPNRIVYVLDKNELRIIAIGKRLDEVIAAREQRGTLREADLVADQGSCAQKYAEVWRQVLVFCCEKARQILGKKWFPLNVVVRVKTANSLTNQRVREAVLHASIRAFGEFRAE
jgi:hypothetical protein